MQIDFSTMSAEELDNFISQAMEARAQAKPEHPQDPPKTQVKVILDPAWFTAPINSGALLQFRHPGFGWLAFAISSENRNLLLSFLLQQALAANINHDNMAPATSTTPGSGGGMIH